MRFDYGSGGQARRVKCKACSLPMLGVDEQDYRDGFCVCPAPGEQAAEWPKELFLVSHRINDGRCTFIKHSIFEEKPAQESVRYVPESILAQAKAEVWEEAALQLDIWPVDAAAGTWPAAIARKRDAFKAAAKGESRG